MVRDFSEEKKEEIFRILDEIDMKDWKPFMEWCGSRAEKFGDWPEKLGISKYTRYVDEYQQEILDLNETVRQQVNTVFENVAEIDARYAAQMRECQEELKEQIAMLHKMSEFMRSLTDASPDMALITKGGVNENGALPEAKTPKEAVPPGQGREGEKPPEVIALDIPRAEMTEDGTIALPENDARNVDIVVDPRSGNAVVLEAKYTAATPESTDLYRPSADKENMDVLERYVSEETLTELGWDISVTKEKWGEGFIEELRALMLEYGLTDEISITFFLMTVSVETGNRANKLEDRGVNGFGGLSYTYNTRGAGLIQLTGSDQREFLEYLLGRTEDEEEREILDKYINNFVDIDPSEENEIWDNPLEKLNDEDDEEASPAEILPPVADYIAENYPIESALWYWCVYKKAEIDGKLFSLNECIETDWNSKYAAGENTDGDYMLMMFTGTQCAVNGSEFSLQGIGRFFMGWNYVEFSEEPYPDPRGSGHEKGSIILHYSEDNGSPDVNRSAQSYKPNGWSASRLPMYIDHIGYFENLPADK